MSPRVGLGPSSRRGNFRVRKRQNRNRQSLNVGALEYLSSMGNSNVQVLAYETRRFCNRTGFRLRVVLGWGGLLRTGNWYAIRPKPNALSSRWDRPILSVSCRVNGSRPVE